MDEYAEGFLKAIDAVVGYSITARLEDKDYQKMLGTTRLEQRIDVIKEVISYLKHYYEKEIKNGIRD